MIRGIAERGRDLFRVCQSQPIPQTEHDRTERQIGAQRTLVTGMRNRRGM
jgi:hypothetical protein